VTENSNEVNSLAEVCATVVDADGRIMAFNDGAREAFALSADATVGTVWTGLLPNDAKERARDALAAAIEGRKSSLTMTDTAGQWQIECLPLTVAPGERPRAMVLLHRHGPTPHATMRAVIHGVTNVISASSSAARMVRRGVDASLAEAIADELEATAHHALAALDDLRSLLGAPKRDEGV
jgi:hypothetical protein